MKIRTPYPSSSRAAIVLAAASILLALVSLLPVAYADGAAPGTRSTPQLSIAVDNGKTSVRPGDTLDYTVTVKNLGTRKVTGLRVSQSLPAGLRLVSSDDRGTAGRTEVRWHLDLKPASTTTLRTTMKVTSTPASLLRLATVACAGLVASSPTVCATHSDLLPAGASAAAAARTTAPAASGHRWWFAGVAALLLGGAALGLTATRRRGHRRLPASR